MRGSGATERHLAKGKGLSRDMKRRCSRAIFFFSIEKRFNRIGIETEEDLSLSPGIARSQHWYSMCAGGARSRHEGPSTCEVLRRGRWASTRDEIPFKVIYLL